MNRVRAMLGSNHFFKWIVVIFLLQAVFSVFFISISTPSDGVGGQYTLRDENGVVPDGHRHMGAIYYYAERPLLASPFITNMTDNDLWMGDLERFPSYLYYYVMSFPVRIMMAFDVPDTSIVLAVRLLTVLIGLVGLIAFYKITKLVTSSRVIQNLATLALAFTGSFVWLSAAESYDIPSLTLWLLFIWSALRLFVKEEPKQLIWMTVLFLFMSVTKYTYIPFAGLFGLIALVLYLRKQPERRWQSKLKQLGIKLWRWVRNCRKWHVAGVATLLLIGGVLFTERIGINLVEYRSFNPNCARIHSHEGCMNFGVYARNYEQRAGLVSGERDPVEWNQFVYVAAWIARYYSSMYVYMGHIYIPQYSVLIIISGAVSLAVLIALLITAKVRRVKLLKISAEKYSMGIILAIVGAQLYHNIGVIMEYGGAFYAHQGRYLLPMIGFLYLFVITAYFRVVASFSSKAQRRMHVFGIAMLLFIVATTSAIPSFFIHAISPEWYSDFALNLLPDIITYRMVQ